MYCGWCFKMLSILKSAKTIFLWGGGKFEELEFKKQFLIGWFGDKLKILYLYLYYLYILKLIFQYLIKLYQHLVWIIKPLHLSTNWSLKPFWNVCFSKTICMCNFPYLFITHRLYKMFITVKYTNSRKCAAFRRKKWFHNICLL